MKEQHNLQNDCSVCKTDEHVATLWGCRGPSPARGGFVYDIGGRPCRRCPLSLLKQATVQHALRLYKAYKRGHLVSAGSLDEQPALYCEVMYTCEALEVSAANWDMKQSQEKANKKTKAMKQRS